MSFDDWRWDRGWRGTVYVSLELAWTAARLLASLALMALVLWVGLAWLVETFGGGS